MSQISAQYCDGLEVRIKELQAENAALKAEIEEWQKSVCEQGEVIEGLKAELASWKSVFGHLGTADECGNEWIALQDKLAAAQKDAFRAGMLAAAEMERSKGK